MTPVILRSLSERSETKGAQGPMHRFLSEERSDETKDGVTS